VGQAVSQPGVVRELAAGETGLAAPALLELHPQHGTRRALVQRVDALQRPTGYRLAGTFVEGEEAAVAACGFRIVPLLGWGDRALYVDDFVTRADRRCAGHGTALFSWLLELARDAGCDELHLDSGVERERRDAHRFYFRHGMAVESFHFVRSVRPSRVDP
jgi:GNAT superfamily N-acetyltransferase